MAVDMSVQYICPDCSCSGLSEFAIDERLSAASRTDVALYVPRLRKSGYIQGYRTGVRVGKRESPISCSTEAQGTAGVLAITLRGQLVSYVATTS